MSNYALMEREEVMEKTALVKILFVAAAGMGLVVYMQSKIVKQTKVDRAKDKFLEDQRNLYRANYLMFLELKRDFESFETEEHGLEDRIYILDEAGSFAESAKLFIKENRLGRVAPTLNDEDLKVLADMEATYQALYEEYLDDADKSSALAFVLLDPKNDPLSKDELQKKLLKMDIPFYGSNMNKKYVYEGLIPLILGTIDLLKEHGDLYDKYKDNVVFTRWEAWLREALKNRK